MLEALLNPSFKAYLAGLTLGFSLIVAIGAQNAFVLRQGLRSEHVLPVCLICAVSDAILISFGVTGFKVISGHFIWLEPLLRYGGAIFLIWYGAMSLRAALKSTGSLLAAENNPAPLKQTLAICLALTWLNPHVYLDTVVMLGLLSAGFPGHVFAAGAITASFVFFFALGYGARLLRPVFARPGVWRVFETLIAGLMFFLAVMLLTVKN